MSRTHVFKRLHRNSHDCHSKWMSAHKTAFTHIIHAFQSWLQILSSSEIGKVNLLLAVFRQGSPFRLGQREGARVKREKTSFIRVSFMSKSIWLMHLKSSEFVWSADRSVGRSVGRLVGWLIVDQKLQLCRFADLQLHRFVLRRYGNTNWNNHCEL